MSRKGINQLRAELKGRKLEFHHGNSGANGTRTIEALHIDTPTPVGIVWYRWVGNKTIDMLGCYVPDYARRCGVLTQMMTALVCAYPKSVDKIITGSATRYSKPWLIKCGFKQDESGDWVKVISKPKDIVIEDDHGNPAAIIKHNKQAQSAELFQSNLEVGKQ